MSTNATQLEQQVLQDFELLSMPGQLGFYARCEETVVFIHDRTSGNSVNVYALAVMGSSRFCVGDLGGFGCA